MTEQKPKTIPYRVFEELEARNKYTVKRLTNIIIILIALLFIASVSVGLVAFYYRSQLETIEIEMDTDGGGNNNYIGESGIITNGVGD